MSCIWRFLYLDVIQPGDNFNMMMRKMIMALSAIVGNLTLLNLLYSTTQPRTNEIVYFYSFLIPTVSVHGST